MKSLHNEEDVDQTLSDSDSRSSSKIIKLDDGDTAIWILSPIYNDGYVHWAEMDDKKRVRVVCAGGIEGAGWTPEECIACDFVRTKYGKAREAANKREAEGIKNYAGRLRAKFEATFIAAKGSMITHRVRRDGKYKDVVVPKFDTDDLEIGFLQLSTAQYRSLVAVKDNYDFIKSFKDCTNRPMVFNKKQRGKDIYKTVEVRPGSRKPQELPEEVEWSEDDFDLSPFYEVNVEKIEEVIAMLNDDNSDDEEDVDIDDSKFYKEDDDDDDDFEDDIP